MGCDIHSREKLGLKAHDACIHCGMDFSELSPDDQLSHLLEVHPAESKRALTEATI